MDKRTFNIDFSDLGLGPAQIEKALGKTGDDSREMVSDIIDEVLDGTNSQALRLLRDEVLENAKRICDIRAEYIIYRDAGFDQGKKSMNIKGVTFGIGKIIWAQIRKSDAVAIFLCTAGDEIGHLSRSLLSEKDFLKGYIYDIAGSEIVEAAADRMQERLRIDAQAEKMDITNRFSPGYCGWNVSEQHELFKLIPDNFCGISLTESALMIPMKSVSGVIGLGKEVRFRPYTCNLCDQENCIYRRNAENRR